MTPQKLGDREHSVGDIMVLLATICLALVTWSSLAETAAAPSWKAYASVAVTLFFALAALTRNPGWARAIRMLTGGWLISAPLLLGFTATAPALWSHLLFGALLVLMAVPGLAALRTNRTRMAA